MSEPVANMSEASKNPPVGAYEDYLLSRGLRYLSNDAKQRKKMFRQFLELFTSAFKLPHVEAKHGYVWALDLRLIDFLINPVTHDLLPGLTLRIDIGSGVIPAITNPIPQRPDPSVTVVFSAELDEDFTIRLICRHLLGEALEAYDAKWPVWNGYDPGRTAPWLIGFIEVLGLLNNGVDLPLYVLEGFGRHTQSPKLANLFIDYECDCPEHWRPTSRKLSFLSVSFLHRFLFPQRTKMLTYRFHSKTFHDHIGEKPEGWSLTAPVTTRHQSVSSPPFFFCNPFL